jgi:hypothetical protein
MDDVPIGRRQDIERARRLAQLLDSAVIIPGTGRSVGLDGLIGLIPVVGDVLGAALSSYLVYVAARAGVPGWHILRMIGNILIDQLVGMVPVLGDIFDFAFKANTRNAAILTALTESGAHLVPRADRGVRRLVLGFALLLGAFLVGSIVLLVLLVQYLLYSWV